VKGRRRCAVAGLAGTLVVSLVMASAAQAGTISATCTWGTQSQTCDSTTWYPSSVSVTWQASPPPDSPTTGCELGIAYHYETDTVNTVSCSATWSGPSPSSASQQYTLHVETSTPTVSVGLPRAPDFNGWYNHPVAASVSGSSFSGIASCSPTSYSGPDATNATVSGSCIDNAGKTASATTSSFQYEASSPVVSAGLSRAPDFNGWYTHPVTAAMSGGSYSGIASCTPGTYSGPDTSTATVAGSCTDNAGKTTSATSAAFQYEALGPTVSVAPSRAADSNGWYTSPVGAAVSGSSVSGIASCTPTTTYAGPDVSNTTVNGACTDNAGKTASASAALNYDATAPTITGAIPSRRPDSNGWYTHPVSFTFTGTDSVSGIASCDTVTYGGPGSGSVLGGCRDRAGNYATRAFPVRYRQGSSPGSNARVASLPLLLRWSAAPHAGYYNVQVYRAGRKVLSAWPTQPSLRVSRSWSFAGHRFHLKPGRYRWYVWPGYGSRTAARYGPVIVAKTFRVAKRP
jgi:hypothetical protein